MQLHDSSLFRQQCYVDGAWIDADAGEKIEVTNPVDSSVIGTVPKLGSDETKRAIDAAAVAWPAWRGLLIDEAGVQKVELHVEDALGKGAKVTTGGKRHDAGSAFFEPTVLTEVTDEMLICDEETFGPVAPLLRFRTEEEAIRLANDTEYGLGSYVYTRDLGRTWRLAEAIESGIVCFNEGVFSTPVAPFGGLKESGVGREGSKYGIDEFLEVKYIVMGGVGT